MTMRISVDLENMTYGELIEFALAARASGVDPATPVTQVPAAQDEDLIVRFEIEVDSLTGEDFIEISPTDARHYAGIIDSVLDNDGDARAEQGALTNLRDVLQGRPA
ncbi:hypothetical protein ACR8AL_07560 [Clavibacter sepedonicus]|uniref:Uncharacterized protein n=1 Tax=Clavibacter sepedonicus TaxID=31964 RepID=B0RJ61_CLASE|nr:MULTISPECIES: hypothetical protein [Clavibacter]MBD5382609.1 hypothetical protein [Clavibacter sp.]OQJ45206.1 hypothetical protein B5P19_15150 [Clavibacter sepedonicus]OQJ45302.1 hypothetical protein B5P19_15705 [Clavibacter sepedonicus]OQJ50841.1 hypothetical protein B5P20_15485 [Clavibacter sepedonicus]OQJ50989.1 hypothetical protein B5P20_16340 [Clavibacter sepedonicus]